MWRVDKLLITWRQDIHPQARNMMANGLQVNILPAENSIMP